jgi:transposase
VPKQRSSGGKDKLGSISKQGDRYLRSLFPIGALAVIRDAKIMAPTHRVADAAADEGVIALAKQDRQQGLGYDGYWPGEFPELRVTQF